MSISPIDIFHTASALATPDVGASCNEADLRSAASRAYYAALHAADQSIPMALKPTDIERCTKGSHQVIIDAIVLWSKGAYQGRSDARDMARNLTKLKTVRKKADYLIGEDFSEQEAANAIVTANGILQNAESATRLCLQTA